MTEADDFLRTLERLDVPQVGDLQHQEFVRRTVLSAPRSAALTIWYVLIPAYLLLCTVMKMAFGMEPHLFVVFDGIVKDLSGSPLGQILPVILLLGLPAAAVLLNLVVLVRGSRADGRDPWHVSVRRRPVNAIIAFLGILMSGLYVLYLLLRAIPGGGSQ